MAYVHKHVKNSLAKFVSPSLNVNGQLARYICRIRKHSLQAHASCFQSNSNCQKVKEGAAIAVRKKGEKKEEVTKHFYLIPQFLMKAVKYK